MRKIKMEIKQYQIWTEGYVVTGGSSTATYHGLSKGETFKQAVENFIEENDWDKKLYNSERLTYWGCKFYDNEADARKTFG